MSPPILRYFVLRQARSRHNLAGATPQGRRAPSPQVVNEVQADKPPGNLARSKTAAELEAMVLAALRRAPHCQGVSSVTVERLDETRFEHTCGVSYIGGDVEPLASEIALKEILPPLRHQYERDSARAAGIGLLPGGFQRQTHRACRRHLGEIPITEGRARLPQFRQTTQSALSA